MKRKIFLISNIILLLMLFGGTSFSQYNYKDALLKGVQFFDANKCGPDAGTNNVFSSWRSACHTTDGSAVGVDLTGGYHDAGDHVKFGLPQTWSAATLGFALYEFKESFDASNATAKTLSTLKYFTDYFLKCHPNANTFYYQVGDGNADHGYWGAPELQTGSRPVIVNNSSAPAADVCGEASAAFSLMYLNYKSVDATYANRCLAAAKSLYTLGKNNPGRSSDGSGGSFYKSTSHFDDLSWAAIWLAIATGDNTYIAPVDAWLDIKNDPGDNNYDKHWAPAWDDVTIYVLLKMYELTGNLKYYNGLVNNMVWYSKTLTKTPYGLPWLDRWGVLRYASSEAGVGYLSAKTFEYADYLATGDLTMNYICGSNPRNSSYLTGFGNNPPVHPHHRANEPNRDGVTKGIVGALVGGPSSDDSYTDNVGDFERNEVAIDYNAAFVLGMAGKVYFTLHTPPKPNVPPTVTLTAPSSSQSYKQGAAVAMSAIATDSDGSIAKVEFYVGTSKVGEDATSPYTASWIAQLAGTYSVSAKAVDNKNGIASSAVVNITVTSDLPDPTTPNLALNKPTSASSLENSGLPSSNAVDGSTGSRWSSAFSDPQWIQVDLQTSQTINRVRLNWEAAYATTYEIQVSANGTTWTAVALIASGNGSIDDIVFTDVNTRYVRMYGTQRVTPYGYSIYEFEVYGSTGTNVPVTGVTVSPATATVNAGSTTTLTATVAPSNATNKSVSWNSSNTAVATVNSSGVVTGIGAGSATITATTVDGAKTASGVVTVSVVNVPVTGVSVTSSATINVGGTTTLTATVTPSNATNKSVSWSSSNTAIATVNNSGVVTGVGIGTATITVTTIVGSFTATSSIIVSDVNIPVTGVTVNPINATVNVGGTTNLMATVAPSNASNKSVSWSSSNTAIATVSSAGVVSGIAVGSAAITVRTVSGGFTATSAITVNGGTTPPCSNLVVITIPFSKDGAGEFCWSTTQAIAYVNSWNMDLLEINGVNLTNKWSNSLPAAIDGKWYIHYKGSYPWSHFEAPALKDASGIEMSQNSVVKVYPNPFSHEVIIDLNGIEGINSIELFNSLGQLIKVVENDQINSQVINLQIEQLGSVFYLRINSDNQIIVKTLIRQ